MKVRVALFFLILLGAMAGFAAIVAGQDLWQRYDTYFVRYTDTSVAGVQVGSTVVYQGIAVGSVESIQIDPQDIESILVELTLNEGTPIKRDVVATIVPVGITGISQIELSGGTQGARTLEPGAFIAASNSTVGQVTESVQSVLSSLEEVLVDISAVVAGIESQSIGSILRRVDSMLVDNEETVSRVIQRIDSLVQENEPAVMNVFRELDAAASGLADAVEQINALTASASGVAGNLDFLVRRNQSDIDESVELLRDTMRLLNNFAFQINSDPSLLILPQERQ